MRYKNGQIVNRPNIPVSNPTDATLLEYGWKPYREERPEITDTQRLEKGTLIETDTEVVQHYDIVELTELEIMQRQQLSEQELKIERLERKIAEYADSNDVTKLKDEDIPYSNGITVYAGDVVVENGERYEVQLPSFTTKEAWRPSTLYAQGNRTLWKKKQPDIPEENLCAETPDWNSANWNDYTVGYMVKHDSAIWKAINTTHTWIAPALEGDGAISWEHVKDCAK